MTELGEPQKQAVYGWIAQAIRNNGPPPPELAEEIRRIYGILAGAAEPKKAKARAENEPSGLKR